MARVASATAFRLPWQTGWEVGLIGIGEPIQDVHIAMLWGELLKEGEREDGGSWHGALIGLATDR